MIVQMFDGSQYIEQRNKIRLLNLAEIKEGITSMFYRCSVNVVFMLYIATKKFFPLAFSGIDYFTQISHVRYIYAKFFNPFLWYISRSAPPPIPTMYI